MSSLTEDEIKYVHSLVHGSEVVDLVTEQHVTELRKSEEHDTEDDDNTDQILRAPRDGRRQLSHGLIKTDVLENLQIEITTNLNTFYII